MFRLALRSVRHNPKRLILTAVAVALGVSLVAATFTFTTSLSNGFTKLFTEIYATTDVVVEADPNAGDDTGGDDPFAITDDVFSAQDVDNVAAVEGVEIAAGGLQVMGSVIPADGPSGSLGGPPTQIFNWYGDPRVDLSTLVDGRGVEADDEIVLDLDAAPALGYELGDTVTLATEAGTTEFTLVGTVRFGVENALQGATLAYISTAAAHELTDSEGFAQVTVVVAEGANKDDVAAAINEVLPEGTRAITGEAKAEEQIEQIDAVLNYINVFAIAFALISLFVGAYIIVNTFRIIVTQRTREFGLLRAVGASGKQIRTTILLEAIIVGIIASTIGIALGYLFALGATALLGALIGDVFGALTLPLQAVLWSYGLGILVTVGAALLPAVHASRISPMEALREAGTESRKPLRVRNIIGGAMTALGVIAVAVGLNASIPRPYAYVGAGAVLLILGVTLLAAQVLVPLAYGLRGALTAMFRIDGKLAANNIRREPRRSANTAAALMIGVMLLALSATFTESLKSVVTAQFAQMHAQFLVLDTQGTGIPQGAIDVIDGVDGVETTSRLGANSARYDGKGFSVASVDHDTADAAFDYNNDPDFTELDGGVFIDPAIQKLGVELGDEVTLEAPEGDVTLTVTGLYLNEGDANFWVDWETGNEMFGDQAILQGLVILDENADVDATEDAITEALEEEFPLVLIQRPDQLQQLANQVIDMILGFVSALLLVALLIALLGVANTLLLSVTERTREIGLLRAVGVKRSSVWRMITIESMVMAIFGTVLGMILGVSLGSALVLSLGDFGFEGVAIPWVWLAVYTVLAAIAGVVAAIWPAWRASRLDILQAIAADG